MPETYAFSHDPERCIKCYSCEIACKEWREIPAGTIKLRRVYEVAAGTFPNVTRTFHSVACQHCSDVPCAGACAPGAITRRTADGVVTVDATKCDGCGKCLAACPFDVPQFDKAGTMHLCDLCADRSAADKGPICVDTCPTGALRLSKDAK